MSRTNLFDTCTLETVDGIPYKTLTCINSMGQIDKHVLSEERYAICEYHFCAVIRNRVNGAHNTLTCSGGMVRFGNDNNNFFNPLTPFGVDYKKMKVMPLSSVELMATNLDFYYAKDIRTTFEYDISSVNCTNSFKTCLKFEHADLCFGNTQNIDVVKSQQALVYGAVTSLVIGTLLLSNVLVFPDLSFIKTKSNFCLFPDLS